MWMGPWRFRTVVTLKHSFLGDKLRVPVVRLKILTQQLQDSTNLLLVIENRSLSDIFDVSELPKSRTEYSGTVWASHIVVRRLTGSKDKIWLDSCLESVRTVHLENCWWGCPTWSQRYPESPMMPPECHWSTRLILHLHKLCKTGILDQAKPNVEHPNYGSPMSAVIPISP